MRCMVKRSQMMKSGAEASTLPKCKYFAQLQFLQEKVTGKETETNVRKSVSNEDFPISSLESPTAISSPPSYSFLTQHTPTLEPAKKKFRGKKSNNQQPQLVLKY